MLFARQANRDSFNHLRDDEAFELVHERVSSHVFPSLLLPIPLPPSPFLESPRSVESENEVHRAPRNVRKLAHHLVRLAFYLTVHESLPVSQKMVLLYREITIVVREQK